ncbi:pyridoxal phosphate-dependent aminotransferase [Pseudaquabacterium pictum]|uniref:Aminotransferase n=1 Tax=Pseudaquabacterium pictum TaxID=2315236 RepID=A0A480AQG2_9BURK|nr:pyridoxal phosphate-dependent aminotransferase [Rubrivivax pictus]GCL61925.1 aminotransferase [Rubrivivax pictus]
MRTASILDRVAGLGSDKWRVHFRARQMIASGEPVILLTIGEPDQPTPDDLIAATHRALQAGRTGYSNGRGEARVLQALAAKYSARSGRTVGTDQFIWVPGTQSALYLLLTGLVEAGDEVLVADPCYATYHGLVRATGAVTVPVALRQDRGFRLDADDLARAVTPATRLIFLNSPHNPTGAVLTRDDIRAIGAVARAHDLWILSDEVYEALIFGGGASFASPFDEADLADRTVVASSLSKSHAAPGFRAGWAGGPAAFISRLLPLAESMLFGAQPFIADMATEALSRDFAITAQMRDAYARRAALVAEVLGAVPGLRVHAPQAGMFVMLSVDGLGLDGEAFADRLLTEAQVAVMPGAAFGAAAAGMVRMSLTVPDAALAEGCARLAALARRLAAR